MIATLLLSAVLAHGAHTLPPPVVHELPRAEQATGRSVLCVSDHFMDQVAKHWHSDQGWAGTWLTQDHAIVMEGSLCSFIAHPRNDRWQGVSDGRALQPETLANAIFVLGHEA